MNKLLIFTLGAAAGSLLTWKILEQKFKQIADEEIEAVREYYKKRSEKYDELDKYDHIKAWKDEVVDTAIDQNKSFDEIEYKTIIGDLDYSNDEEEDEPDDIHEVWMEPGVDFIEPFVIRPEEYGDKGFEMKEWTYYADFVLTDDEDEIVVDPENIIGDALSHFGEYEEDSVYVRNENTECDYEILKHEKTFSQINGVNI